MYLPGINSWTDRRSALSLLSFRFDDDHGISISSINGNSPKYLSKSLWNKRSWTIRYFSNSVSAYYLAVSAATLHGVGKTSFPPAAKIVLICFAQSSIVIGMWRFAIRSANSSTPFTNCPMSDNSTSFR